MRRKEILKDYKLEPTEVGGKIKTIAVYVGDKFSYAIDKKELRAYRIIIPILLLFSLASILVPMLLNSLSAKTWYIVLPGIIAALLTVITTIKISSLYSKKEFLTRKDVSDIEACRMPLLLSRLALLVVIFVERIVILLIYLKTTNIAIELVGLVLTILAINLSIFEFVINTNIEIKPVDKLVSMDDCLENDGDLIETADEQNARSAAISLNQENDENIEDVTSEQNASSEEFSH